MDESGPMAARAQLAPYAVQQQTHIPPTTSAVLAGLVAVLGTPPATRPAEVSLDDLRTALTLIPDDQRRLQVTERLVIEALKDGGLSWTELGTILGVSRQAAKKRYE